MTGTIPDWVKHRKGSRRLADIPEPVLHWLQAGKIESANLMEWLAIDQSILLQNVWRQLPVERDLSFILKKLEQAGTRTGLKAMRAIAEALYMMEKDGELPSSTRSGLAVYPSDMVRCWSAHLVGLDHALFLEEKLAQIKPFAADKHFHVREVAWLAVRDAISEQLQPAIQQLQTWVVDEDENIRRFAIEVTRPRGVWCKHIQSLKENPALALPVLEPVKADPAKYVQESVGNWLNDASKSNPDWVSTICKRWLIQSDNPHTQRILKKGKRTMRKEKG